MTAFIDAHRAASGVEPICGALPIAPSTDHGHAARRADPAKLPARAKRDAELRGAIRRAWAANFRLSGLRQVWRRVRREGIEVARCTVARLRRGLGLRGSVRGKAVRTTRSGSDEAAPPSAGPG